MRHLKRFALLLFLLNAAALLGIGQLRNPSKYFENRINTDLTQFILHDSGNPEFTWASEWAFDTVQYNGGKAAILIWYFKDGSKAYSLQCGDVDEIGKQFDYLLTNKASYLEDIHRKKIQPLTLDNYPVKIELWLGEIGETTGYSPEMKGSEVCLNASTIKYNTPYYFSRCPQDQNQSQ